MRPEDQFTDHEVTVLRSERRRGLFFFESVGGRTYFRFTRLAVALIAAFIIFPIAALLILFLSRPAIDETKVDVTVRPLPNPTFSNRPLIKQPSPPKPPQALRQQPLPTAPSPPALKSTPGVEIDQHKQVATPPAPQPRVP
jgi:hypothetical protein